MRIKLHEESDSRYVITYAFGRYSSDKSSGNLRNASSLVSSHEFKSPKDLYEHVFDTLDLDRTKCTVFFHEGTPENLAMEVVHDKGDEIQTYLVGIKGYTMVPSDPESYRKDFERLK